MIKENKNTPSFLDIKNLKILLIIWTFVRITLLILFFSNLIDLELSTKIAIAVIAFSIRGLFILFIWKRKEFDKKFKTNNSILIFFLGILGMWFFILDKKVKKLEEKNEVSSSLT